MTCIRPAALAGPSSSRNLRDHACVVFHPLEGMASALESPTSHDRAKELADAVRGAYDSLFPRVDG